MGHVYRLETVACCGATAVARPIRQSEMLARTKEPLINKRTKLRLVTSTSRIHRAVSELTGFRTLPMQSDDELYAPVGARWCEDAVDLREQYRLLPDSMTRR